MEVQTGCKERKEKVHQQKDFYKPNKTDKNKDKARTEQQRASKTDAICGTV